MNVNFIKGLSGSVRVKYPLQPSPSGLNVTSALAMGIGSASYPEPTALAAKSFFSYYTKTTDVGDDNRNHYMRHYLAGIGIGGEALRAYTTVLAVAAANARGAHISLDFSAYATSYITGEGRAVKATLHVPDGAMHAGGTYSALQAEIYCDGTSSDPSAVTEMALIDGTVQGGNSTSQGKVKNFLALHIPTGEEADDKMHVTTITAATINAACTEALRVMINGAVRWIPIATAVA